MAKTPTAIPFSCPTASFLYPLVIARRNPPFCPFPQTDVTDNLAVLLQLLSNAYMRREKRYYVYILASKSRALYIGMTGFLTARILQHKVGEPDSFARRYNINRLVYFESFGYVNNAISRETELKSWSRKRKVALIETSNPLWNDLAEDWGKPVGMKKQIPTHGLAVAPPGSE